MDDHHWGQELSAISSSRKSRYAAGGDFSLLQWLYFKVMFEFEVISGDLNLPLGIFNVSWYTNRFPLTWHIMPLGDAP